MRGATPYSLRGTPLAVPNGTVENPSVRFGRERTGLYRVDDGVLGLAVKQFPALDVTEEDTVVRSNAAANAHAPLLSLVRANAATASGAETRIDFYNDVNLSGRIANYRSGSLEATTWGLKLYTAAGPVLNAAPALTLDPSNNATVHGQVLSLSPSAPITPVLAVWAPTNQNAQLQILNSAANQGGYLAYHGNPAAGQYLAASLQGDISLFTVGAYPGRLHLGAAGVSRLMIDQPGNAFYKLPPGGGFNIVRSIDSNAAFQVVDLGGAGNVANLLGRLSIDGPGAAHAGDWQNASIIATARSGVAGISFHRPGLFAAMLYESGGNLWWGGTQITGAQITGAQIADGTIGAAEIADGSVGAAEIANGSIGPDEIATRSLTDGQIAPYAIINPTPHYLVGPPSNVDLGSSAWHPIPGLTVTFNPTSQWARWICWVQLSVAHSSGGRAMIGLAVNGVLQVTSVPGANGKSSLGADGLYQLQMFGIVGPGNWPTTTFAVWVYPLDLGGIVRVQGADGRLLLWEVKR